jgi:hypothetical protein
VYDLAGLELSQERKLGKYLIPAETLWRAHVLRTLSKSKTILVAQNLGFGQKDQQNGYQKG